MLSTLPKRLAVAAAVLALSGATAEAQLIGDQKFDFEDGEASLFDFDADGDAGVADFNVIEGNFSAFITTFPDPDPLSGNNAAGNVCSGLKTPFIFPKTRRSTLRVEFETIYKTDENVGSFASFEDPFHTELVTKRGAVDVLTIKTDGIFFSNSQPQTVVFEEGQKGGDVRLPRPPFIPTFVDGGLLDQETRELSVISTLSLAGNGCAPVQLKFSICDEEDAEVGSAAFIDEVEFDFTNNGTKCPPPDMSILSLQGSARERPGPRE